MSRTSDLLKKRNEERERAQASSVTIPTGGISAGGSRTQRLMAQNGLPTTFDSTTPANAKTTTPPVRREETTEAPPSVVQDQPKEKYSLLKGIGGVLQKGLSQIAQAGGNTLAFAEDVALAPFELLSGLELGDLSDNAPINTWAKNIRQEGAAVQEHYAGNVAAGGKAAELFDRYGSAAVAAVPQAVAALLSGGTSAIATTAGLQGAATAAISPSVANTVNTTVSKMAADPQYWLSFSQIVGNSYESALADMEEKGGYDNSSMRTKAALQALGNGLMGAAVEVGGGIQKLPDELRHGESVWRALVDTGIDEGKEEVIQGIIDRATQNLFYNKGNPLASLNDPNAVVSLPAAVDEFAGGAIVGGLLGGGQAGIMSAGRALANRMSKPAIVEELVSAGATEADAETLAPILEAVLTGEEISGNQAGAIAKNEAAVSVLESATGEAINTDAPLGEVKTAIRSLASRRSAQAEPAAAEDTPVQMQPVQAVEMPPTPAPAPVSTPPVAVTGKESVQEFAATLGKAGERVFNDMYNEEQNAVSYVDAMMKAYNAGKNGGSLGGISSNIVTPPQLQAAYMAGQADAPTIQVHVAENGDKSYTANRPGMADLGMQLSIRDVATVNGIKFTLRQTGDGKYTVSIDRDTAAMGGYVTDARAHIYDAGPFATRSEAVREALDVARYNNLTEQEDGNGQEERSGETAESGSGTPAEDGSRPGVSEESRGNESEVRETSAGLRERHGRLIAQAADYGLTAHIVSSAEWPAEYNGIHAYTRAGEIYLHENAPADYEDVLIPHEGTHAMKQLKFRPYLDFLERTPDMVEFTSGGGQALLSGAAEHRKIDLMEIDDAQVDILYDEINAMVSGIAISGKDGRILANLKEAFQDYEAYKKELLSIHQQFKNRNQAEQEPSAPATTEEQIEVKEELGNQKQPKGQAPLPAKTKSLLDKSKAMVVGSGKDRFLTDGYVALAVNDEQASYAGSEWGVNARPDSDLTAKTIRELAEKNAYAAIIGNPVEIKAGSRDAYVFEIEDGKQIGVQKKYAKYFDGLTFSAAIKDNGFPIALKVTDSDGDLVGVIMPLRPDKKNGVYSFDTSNGKSVTMRSFNGKQASTKKKSANKKPAREKTVETTVKPADIQYSILDMAAANDPSRWSANRIGAKKPMRLSELIEKIHHDFGINITTGHIQGKGVQGQYNRRDKGIRTKIANDLPTVTHELGHALNDRYGLLDKPLSVEMKTELENALGEMKGGYSKERWHSEGLAEYIRKFLQNRETAAIDYPVFTEYFLNSLSAKDAALIEQLADEINAYYSLDADTATSSIRLREEGAADARTVGEKIKAKASVLYQAWIDGNQGIKEFDTATGGNTYKLATNSAYSDAIAGQIVVGDLTDANGQYVAPGLKAALHGLDLNNKQEYRLFGEYLLVKHGPERLAEGMRIFADDRKNSTAFMQRRQAELEQQYPHFEEISKRLYDFQKKFLQTWGVGTGLVSPTSADDWGKRWEFYVPLNRAVSVDKRGIGAKRGFANQSSTIKRARGSGLDVVHPVDNIINNVVKMVNAGVRNNVMRSITDTAEALGADAAFLEKVPTPMVKRGFDMTGVKAQLTDWFGESDMQTDDKFKAAGIVSNLDDILYQYGRGKAHGDVITVLKNGDQEFWKINDPLLLSSVTNMAPKKMEGILDAYAMVSRFMTANITGNNIIWSIFSNFPRDMGTFFTYSKVRNPAKVFASMGSAYVNKIKGDNADPLYKEYLAMGGGKTSAYTADRDLAKKARKALSNRKISANPLDWIGFVSDTVELGPRFATYKMLRQAGMGQQEAFYEAMDITVNFRRGGEISRQINKVVPFFNASVQGLDKFHRWITATDAPAETRSKVVRSRMISYVAVSAVLAALFYGLNNGDEEKEKDYEQLSNYTKNSYWNIPLGDGKYFSIPKPRDLGVLTSFFETCMEYGIGENNRAFDEFYSYAADNWLPSVASDVAQGDISGAIGSLGIVGVGSYMMANRDFLGRPIVSSGLQNLEAKDQYNERTSKIAYWVGQAFNASPQMVDYFFNSVLGGWWKSQKALFPVGKENVDYTLGVQNSYIKDNQYSTDLVNWLYDQAEASQKAKNSDSGNMEKAIAYKMDSNMTTFYSRYYKLAKNVAETTATRATRQTVLNMILEYQKAADSGELTAAQRAVYAVCERQGSTENLPSVMQAEIKDGNDRKHTLSDVQYVEYQTDYLRLYWNYVEANLNTHDTKAQQAAVLAAAKDVAKQEATNRTLSRIGAAKTDYFAEFEGVSNNTVISYKAQRDLANDDGSLKQDEVIGILELMIANEGLSYEEAYILFHSEYTSDKNNPWKKYKN